MSDLCFPGTMLMLVSMAVAILETRSTATSTITTTTIAIRIISGSHLVLTKLPLPTLHYIKNYLEQCRL